LCLILGEFLKGVAGDEFEQGSIKEKEAKSG
jgi:hypothetical protein